VKGSANFNYRYFIDFYPAFLLQIVEHYNADTQENNLSELIHGFGVSFFAFSQVMIDGHL
jgi:hypothetical protein